MSYSINRKEVLRFKRIKNTYRLVWCSFTLSYLLEQKDNKSEAWFEKYISNELAKWIKDKYK